MDVYSSKSPHLVFGDLEILHGILTWPIVYGSNLQSSTSNLKRSHKETAQADVMGVTIANATQTGSSDYLLYVIPGGSK
jgi:hypothetical protein